MIRGLLKLILSLVLLMAYGKLQHSGSLLSLDINSLVPSGSRQLIMNKHIAAPFYPFFSTSSFAGSMEGELCHISSDTFYYHRCSYRTTRIN